MSSEKPPLLGKVQLGRIVPANPAATQALSSVNGQTIRFEIKRMGANQRRRGFYWVMMAVAAEAMTDATGFSFDEELLHGTLKQKLGLGESFTTPSGHTIFKPQSTSNRAMNEVERARWTDRCAHVLSTWLGVEISELIDEARARNGGVGPGDERQAA
jgi:hypothetical protein